MKKKDIVFAIVIYMIFPLSSILMKYAATNENLWYKLLLFGSAIGVLGVFSILWQILLKRVDLVKAYIFKSTNIIWTVIYGVILFNEEVSVTMIIGMVIVIAGTIVASIGSNKQEKLQIGEKTHE